MAVRRVFCVVLFAVACSRRSAPLPTPVATATPSIADAGVEAGWSGPHASAMAVGDYVWMVRMDDGTVWSWGFDSVGETGHPAGTRTDHTTPAEIPGLRDVAVVAAQGHHACALLTNGHVECWGESRSGELGAGVAVKATNVLPTLVPDIDDALDVAVGDEHTCAVRRDGTVWCWGANTFGALARGTDDFEPHPTPARAGDIKDAESVVIDGSTTCVRLHSGRVRCWGLNSYGQVGIPQSIAPTWPVAFGTVDSATDMALGNGGTCAILADGTLRCSGYDGHDRLGPTKETCRNGLFFIDVDPCRSRPTLVAGVTDVVALALGSHHACALQRSRDVVCWGANDKGQLGAATPASSVLPVKVPGLADVVQIGGHNDYTMALDRAGRVVVWGDPGSAWKKGAPSDVVRIAGLGPP
jgi:alpha-tubulin suppressor-like RCC1 family protein